MPPMEYTVLRTNRKTFCAEIRQNRLTIRAPLRASDADVRRFVQQNRQWIETHWAKMQAAEQAKEAVPKLTQEEIVALANRALEVIPKRVAHFAAQIGVRYGRITIRRQKSRWGSCSSKGNLNFNCLLMLTPPEVLDSVVVHELCHRKEMNHSDRFYAEVLRVCPDYWAQDKWLKQNGATLLAMGNQPNP